MHIDKLFEIEKTKRLKSYIKDNIFLNLISKINNLLAVKKYSYNFNWLGTPIIQNPSDMILVQEVIFKVKPDLIIETGIARAGSLIFYSTILNMINKNAKIIGIDVDIRKHAKKSISNHNIKNIITVKGSSIDHNIFNKVQLIAKKNKKILVLLDSIHTHNHVLEELELYSKIISKNSYIVVFDTTPHYLDNKTLKIIKKNYPHFLSKKSNARTAIDEFLYKNKKFRIDKELNTRSLITNCHDGFLKKIS
ncbi:cephalosporin hydroxylase family protein [Alphaproteobacteria bacterium]|nr:cephalosporin hydroxylase family protein [Alphaproteobacteria bacterium]